MGRLIRLILSQSIIYGTENHRPLGKGERIVRIQSPLFHAIILAFWLNDLNIDG